MPLRVFRVTGVFGTSTEVGGVPVRHFIYNRVTGNSLLLRRDAVAPTYCPWITMTIRVRGDPDEPTHVHEILRIVQIRIAGEINLLGALGYYLRNLAEGSTSNTLSDWRACYKSSLDMVTSADQLSLQIPAQMSRPVTMRLQALHNGFLGNMDGLWLGVHLETRKADEVLLCYFSEGVLSMLTPEQRRQFHRHFFDTPANFWKLFCWPFFVHGLREALSPPLPSSLLQMDFLRLCVAWRPQDRHRYTILDPRATFDQTSTKWRQSNVGVHTQQIVEFIREQYHLLIWESCDIYPLRDHVFSQPPYRVIDDGSKWCCYEANYLLVERCSAWLQRRAQNIWLYDTRRTSHFAEYCPYLMGLVGADTTHTVLLTTSSTRSEILSSRTALPWYSLVGGTSSDIKVGTGVTRIVLDNAHKTSLCEVVEWIRAHVDLAPEEFRLHVIGNSLAFGCTYLRFSGGNFFRDLLCVRAPALPFVVSRPLSGFHAFSAHELVLLKGLYSKTTRNLPVFTVGKFSEDGKAILDAFAAQISLIKTAPDSGVTKPERDIDFQILFLDEGHCNTFIELCQRHGFPRQQNQETVSNNWIRCRAPIYVRSTGDIGKIDSIRSRAVDNQVRAENVKKRGVDSRESIIEIQFSRGKRRKTDSMAGPTPLTIDCSRGEKIQPPFVQTLSLDDSPVRAYTFLEVPEDDSLDLRKVVAALNQTSTRLIFFGRDPRKGLEILCKKIDQQGSLKHMKSFIRGISKTLRLAHIDIFETMRDQELAKHKERCSLFAHTFALHFHYASRDHHV